MFWQMTYFISWTILHCYNASHVKWYFTGWKFAVLICNYTKFPGKNSLPVLIVTSPRLFLISIIVTIHFHNVAHIRYFVAPEATTEHTHINHNLPYSTDNAAGLLIICSTDVSLLSWAAAVLPSICDATVLAPSLDATRSSTPKKKKKIITVCTSILQQSWMWRPSKCLWWSPHPWLLQYRGAYSNYFFFNFGLSSDIDSEFLSRILPYNKKSWCTILYIYNFCF